MMFPQDSVYRALVFISVFHKILRIAQIFSDELLDDGKMRESMNKQIAKRDKANLKFHRGMVDLLEQRLRDNTD